MDYPDEEVFTSHGFLSLVAFVSLMVVVGSSVSNGNWQIEALNPGSVEIDTHTVDCPDLNGDGVLRGSHSVRPKL